MSIVFGPIISRRFGVSLGIDLSPSFKQCNFNCIYCELEAKNAQESQIKITPVNDILQEIESALQKDSKIDVLTFSANGEPTLYPFLFDLITQSKKILQNYSHIKTLILSNGSRFRECKDALMEFDIVKFSLDSVDELIFKRVDKPLKSLNLDSMLSGIREFSQEFKGDLIAEILIVKDVNDDCEKLKKSVEFLRTIKLKRLDISTIDRPSSHHVFPVSNEKLYEIAGIFDGISVNVAHRKNENIDIEKRGYNKDELLLLIKRRPLSVKDASILLNDESLEILKDLLRHDFVIIKNVSNIDFYYVNSK